MINSQTEVGGWPKLAAAPAEADADNDGMPDAWENKHGLNPRDASVYTNLGNIYLETGQREEAISSFREAVAIDPAALAAKDRLRALEAY